MFMAATVFEIPEGVRLAPANPPPPPLAAGVGTKRLGTGRVNMISMLFESVKKLI